jgi:hypothetical protein
MVGALVGFMKSGVFMQVAGGTILTGPLFLEIILPFVLLFTILFALLQKSQILGKDKRQIDAIVSLVLGLIVVSFANAVGIITSLVPFLAVAVVIILVFLILWSMVFQGDEPFKVNKGLKVALGILIGVAVVVAVLIATGAWDYIKYEWIYAGDNSALFTNVIFLVIVVVAIAIVVWPGKKEDK